MGWGGPATTAALLYFCTGANGRTDAQMVSEFNI